MTDSCIGGKSSINAGDVKNLVGNIYPPNEIMIDVKFLETLQQVDVNAGLAEAAKIAFCKGSDAFTFFLEAAVNKSATGYAELLYFVLSQKKWFIEIDEFDRAERKFLNFGHTFGHAVEKHAKYFLRHGECVAIGMAFIAHLQSELGLITDDIRDLHLSILTGINLPITYSAGDWPELRALMSMDKKSRGNTLRFVTISEIGKTDRIADVAQGHLLSAYEKVCS
jgi:3-dehydroquinate synthase